MGSGQASLDELAVAEEAGAAVAEAGCGLVCGGLGGVMEAACRGARSRGGLTLGLLPGLDREAANGWVVVAVPTGLGEEIALALKAGLPVVGIGTWQPVLDGEVAGGVVGADDPKFAVAEALRLAGR